MIESIFSLRFRLVVLVLLTASPLVGLTLHTASQERRRLVREWEQRAQEMMELAAREEGQVIGQTRQLLLALAESAAVRSGNQQDCRALLDELLGSYPRYANLGVVSTNGTVLASARPVSGPANPMARTFFRRALASRNFAIGDFQDGQTVGQPTVDFGYPVFDSAGRAQAVVFAALDLDWVSRFESTLPAQLPPGTTWTEIDRSGRVLVRHPAPEKGIDQPCPGKSLLDTVFSQNHGVVETKSLDGMPGFHAFAARRSQLVDDDVVTILGSIPKAVLFAEANRRLAINLTWLGIAACLAFLLGSISSHFLILRPVQALVQSSARLAAGDLSTRTGTPLRGGEFGQLTRAFDQMAQALEQREAERQVISRRLVQVQETERRRLARELHDEIGQALTAIEMNLQALLESPGTDAAGARLRENLAVVERVQEQVHDLSLNLRPSMLDDLGLEPALRWYAERQAALAGLQAEVQAEQVARRLDPAVETECFRVAQEALNNVVKHAKARSVIVELRHSDGQLHLSVRDDGVGFNVAQGREQAVRGGSLGLLSMEERAVLAGGGLRYHSAPGRGTEVHAWFPLKWAPPTILIEAI